MAIDESHLDKFVEKYGLSKRQRDVLREFLTDPQATSEIVGPRIGCSPSTVNVHLSKIFEKTGFKNKRDLLKQLSEQSHALDSPQSTIRSITVLMADDDPIFRKKVLASLSTAAGNKVHVVECENGLETMMYLSRAKRGDQQYPIPDMILLDLIMPQMNGMMALEKIKTDPELANIPVIIFSSNAAKEAINETYSIGSNSFIMKPVQDAEIDRVIHLLLQYWGRFGSPPVR